MPRALGNDPSELIGERSETVIADIPVDAVVPNRWQPRTEFSDAAANELADSIREHGILQPLVVRPFKDGLFELIAGERRLRAAKLAGLKTVPAVVRMATDRESLVIALVENIQREDISPLESARAYRTLIDKYGLTQEVLAQKVGKSRAAVANTIRLLKLPPRIQESLERCEISEGHARALLSFGDEADQLAVFDQVRERGLTVHEVERLSQIGAGRTRPKRESVCKSDPNWLALADHLAMGLGAPVKLEGSENGGRIVVSFSSEEDLARIADIIGSPI